jgi:hypothetical protein
MKQLTKRWYVAKKKSLRDFNFLDYPFLFSTISKVDILQAESSLEMND